MYYIEKENKILFVDTDKDKLINTLLFQPDLTESDIKEVPEGYTIKDNKLLTEDEAAKELAQEERNRKDLLALTRCDVLKALYKAKGITPDDIKLALKDNVEALIELEYAQNFYRGHPIINQVGTQLGFTTEELDYLFEHKEFPTEGDNN